MSDDKINMRVLLDANNPDGLRVVSSARFSAQVYAFPRQMYNDVCANQSYEGLNAPCVYILWASGGKPPKPQVYVGESDTLQNRMVQHYQGKQFWERAAVYADARGGLNKTQTLYIEAHLIRLAKDAGLCELENVNEPRPRKLNEGDEYDAKAHLKVLCRFFLPLAGCDFFNPNPNRPLLQETLKQTHPRKDEQIIAVPDVSVPVPVKDAFQIIRDHAIDVNFPDGYGTATVHKIRIATILNAVLNNESISLPGANDIKAHPEYLWHTLANFGVVAPLDQGKGSGHRGKPSGPDDGFVWIEAASADIKQLFKKECGYSNYQPQLTANGGEMLKGQRTRRHSKRRVYYINVPISKFLPEFKNAQ